MISPEALQANQQMLKWLGFDLDLPEAADKDQIILPSQEQQESATSLGYTQSLIIPGNLPRKQLIETVSQRYAQEFQSYQNQGVWFSDQAQRDLNQTQAVINPSRPSQLYLINLRPKTNLNQAHPETNDLTFLQCQQLLDQENQKDPNLNLRGPTLQEYLLADALCFQTTNQHLDQFPWSWQWLLEEQILEDNQPVRCLDARWDSDFRRVGVYSYTAQIRYAIWGACFAAVPSTF